MGVSSPMTLWLPGVSDLSKRRTCIPSSANVNRRVIVYSPSDVNRPSFWMHIESTAMVISVCLPTMRIIFLEMAAKRVRSLRSFASKLSTRGSTEATKQSTSLSRSRSTRNYTELDNLPPASGTPEYSCEAGRASEVDQSIRFAHHRDSKSGILVSKTIHQATE